MYLFINQTQLGCKWSLAEQLVWLSTLSLVCFDQRVTRRYNASILFKKSRRNSATHSQHLQMDPRNETAQGQHIGAQRGQVYGLHESSSPLWLLSEQIGCQMKSVCQETLCCTVQTVM